MTAFWRFIRVIASKGTICRKFSAILPKTGLRNGCASRKLTLMPPAPSPGHLPQKRGPGAEAGVRALRQWAFWPTLRPSLIGEPHGA